MSTPLLGHTVPFPLSHVTVGRTLTLDDFFGCQPCADGEHGSEEDGRCLCCSWDVTVKQGTFIPIRKELLP